MSAIKRKLSTIPEESIPVAPAVTAKVSRKRKTFTASCLECKKGCQGDELERCDCTGCSRPGFKVVICGRCISRHLRLDSVSLGVPAAAVETDEPTQPKPKKQKLKRTVTLCDISNAGCMSVYEVDKIPAGGIKTLQSFLYDEPDTKADHKAHNEYREQLDECETLWSGTAWDDPMTEHTINVLSAVYN